MLEATSEQCQWGPNSIILLTMVIRFAIDFYRRCRADMLASTDGHDLCPTLKH